MKLVLKSTVALLIIFVAALGALGWMQVRREAEGFERAATKDSLVTGRSLRSMIHEVWQVEGGTRALEALARANASLPDFDVRALELEAPAPSREHLTRDQRDRLIRGQELILVQRPDGDTKRVYVYVPWIHPPDAPMALEVSRALTEEKAAVGGIIRDEVLATIGMAGGGTLIASLVGVWFVGRPMRKLVKQARRIGEGDFSHKPAISQRDEVGDLAREIETMSDQLRNTQRKLAAENEERVRVLEQLRHADRLTTVGTLAAGMAHELGTPLNVVAGRAKLIAPGRLSPEQVAEGSRIIIAQVDRMTNIIRQLLDFARRGEATKAPIDVSALAHRTTKLLETLARKRGVAVELSHTEGPTLVMGDAAQLEQVLTNLIVNGIQAMTVGVLRVSVSCANEEPPPDHGGRCGPYLRVEVRDEGCGIPRELLPRVFEPFFTTKPIGEGTGLGLSVAYGIVRDHGGWMSVSSEAGLGSAFTLHLPVAKAA
jgi:two-component system NtrC family sensor kinase